MQNLLLGLFQSIFSMDEPVEDYNKFFETSEDQTAPSFGQVLNTVELEYQYVPMQGSQTLELKYIENKQQEDSG